jgi:hypothetical protein
MSTKPAFKARARKLLRAAAPYCTPGEGFDRLIRDRASNVRRVLAGACSGSIHRALDHLQLALALADATTAEERRALCLAAVAA